MHNAFDVVAVEKPYRTRPVIEAAAFLSYISDLCEGMAKQIPTNIKNTSSL